MSAADGGVALRSHVTAPSASARDGSRAGIRCQVPLRCRPRNRSKRMFADRGYDVDKYRRPLWKRGIKPLIARRGAAHRSGWEKTRWVVERTFAWLHHLNRLRVRYEPAPAPAWPPSASPQPSAAVNGWSGPLRRARSQRGAKFRT